MQDYRVICWLYVNVYVPFKIFFFVFYKLRVLLIHKSSDEH